MTLEVATSYAKDDSYLMKWCRLCWSLHLHCVHFSVGFFLVWFGLGLFLVAIFCLVFFI